MSYQVDARKVRGVVTEITDALKQCDGCNVAETLVGLSEVIGRIIVDVTVTTVQRDEMVDVVVKHIGVTLKTGFDAKEKSLIARV